MTPGSTIGVADVLATFARNYSDDAEEAAKAIEAIVLVVVIEGLRKSIVVEHDDRRHLASFMTLAN